MWTCSGLNARWDVGENSDSFVGLFELIAEETN